MAKLQKVSTLDSSERPPKGIYILPNLFTTASLFAAFYAIIQSTVGNFENAAIAVIIAAVLDSLDGRVARMTNTVSDFGKEYDSLVDLVAFGLAPALILFEWGLKDLGKVGWLTAFIYVATTALRLARFNTQDSPSKRYFQGLPCPAAAVLLAAGIWTAATYNVTGGLYTIVGLGTMFLLSMAMVSPLPYRSFKDLDLKHRVPFMAVLGLVLVFVLISFDPPRVLLVAFSSYAVSGLIVWGLLRRSGEQVFGQKDVKSPEEPEGDPIVSGENVSGRVNRP
ncbi:MAG: CDP-diacylglycerol--serine O-phosphatidyltransferase [Proteobacteria bacterium]|nr:CDP-diacylglycerol--serine O-phosphatidyltransferase [Pseudomonadota bacterium]